MNSGTSLLVRLPRIGTESYAPPLRQTLDRLQIEPIDPAAVVRYKRLRVGQAHRQACRQWAQAVLLLLALFCGWSLIERWLFPRSAISLPLVVGAFFATAFTAIGINAATHFFENLPGWAIWVPVPVMFYSRRVLREYGLPKEVAQQVRAIADRHPRVCFVMHRLDEDPILDVKVGDECYTIAIWG